jgi:hypothetical protein
MGMELVFQETFPLSIIGASIGITGVTSMILVAKKKVTTKGIARRNRLILLSFFLHPCDGLKGWCVLSDAFGGGKYDYENMMLVPG